MDGLMDDVNTKRGHVVMSVSAASVGSIGPRVRLWFHHRYKWDHKRHDGGSEIDSSMYFFDTFLIEDVKERDRKRATTYHRRRAWDPESESEIGRADQPNGQRPCWFARRTEAPWHSADLTWLDLTWPGPRELYNRRRSVLTGELSGCL